MDTDRNQPHSPLEPKAEVTLVHEVDTDLRTMNIGLDIITATL